MTEIVLRSDRPLNRLDVDAKCVNGSATVGVASVSVLGANGKRVGATFVNDSDTVIYLTKGHTAVLNTGIRLNANGGSYEITMLNLWKGEISAISSAATKNLVWTEQE